MIALTVSFAELLDLARGNLNRWPDFLKHLRWEGDRMVMEIQREENEIFPAAVDILLRFHGETFTVTVNSGTIKGIMILSFKSGEFFHSIERNMSKFPHILKAVEYDNVRKIFALTMDPEDEKDIPMDKRLFRKKFKLLTQLEPLPGKKIRVRVAGQ